MKRIARLIDCFSVLSLPDMRALKASGDDGACRYLGAHTHPQWGKGITQAELQNAAKADFKVVFIWEGDSTSRRYFTPAQGEQDGKDILAELVYLGIKPNARIVVYVSVDYDAYTQADFDAVDAYLGALMRVIDGRYGIGVYGGLPVLEFLASEKSKSNPVHYWQTIAWSGGRLFAHPNLYQDRINERVDGVSVDINEVYVPPGWYPVDPEPKAPSEQHYRVVLPNEFTDLDHADQIAMQISKLGVAAKVEVA